jgi:pyrroline-5-carboxylate reductase
MAIGLIGAGNMARALALGWGEPVVCCDSGSGRAAALVAEVGGEAVADAAEVARRCEIIVLCHKPKQTPEIAGSIDELANGIVVSVLGGVTVATLAHLYRHAAVVRTMPNTAVAVRDGTTILAPGEAQHAQAFERVRELFARLGEVVVLPEAQLETATAISGVGPAYVALLAEAQVDAGVRRGLSPAIATELVCATLRGTATLIGARDGNTLAVRREVTSPGGSTARGLRALERAGVREAFAAAMDAVLDGEAVGGRT